VIRDVFALFTFAEAKVEVIWFDTLVSATDKVTQSITAGLSSDSMHYATADSAPGVATWEVTLSA